MLGNSQTESSQTETGELILKDTEVSMPLVLGLSEDMAESTLKDSSLTMKRTYEYFDDVEKGHVAKQDPAAKGRSGECCYQQRHRQAGFK